MRQTLKKTATDKPKAGSRVGTKSKQKTNKNKKMKKSLVVIMSMVLTVLAINSQAQLKKVAIISIYGNKKLGNAGGSASLGGGTSIGDLNNLMLSDSAYNLTGIVEKFASLVSNDLLKEFPFPFVPKGDVVNNPAYKNLIDESKHFSRASYEGNHPSVQVAEGYIPLAANGFLDDDTKAIKKSFEFLPADVDGVMIAYLDFDLQNSGASAFGVSSKKGFAFANIKIFNREGKRIFKLKDSEKSKGSITTVMGMMTDPKKVVPLINDASDKLFAELLKEMPKSISKLAKKIDAQKED